MSETKIGQEVTVGIVRSIFAAIPWVGGALTEAVFDIRGRVKQQRFEALVEELSKRLNAIEQRKLSTETIRTEEFSDQVEQVIQKVLANRSREKLGIFADILGASMCPGFMKAFPLRDLYVTTLSQLEDEEMQVLRGLYTYFADRPEVELRRLKTEGKDLDLKIDYTNPILFGVPTETFRVCFESLIAKGLVSDDTIGRWGGGVRDYIKMTPLAIQFLAFIRAAQDEIRSSKPQEP